MADRAESPPDTAADSVWYRLGYALERTRAASPPPRLRSLSGRFGRRNDAGAGERRPDRSDDETSAGATHPVDVLLAAGAGTLAARVLRLWPARRSPGVLGLARAGVAGAAAALLRRVLQPLLDRGRLEVGDDTAGVVAAGAARGLLYASVVEPRLFGGPVVRGALYGAIEYGVSPWGGLNGVLGRHAHRGAPFLTGLFEGYDPADDTFVDHVAFAVALAVLYDAVGGTDPGA